MSSRCYPAAWTHPKSANPQRSYTLLNRAESPEFTCAL